MKTYLIFDEYDNTVIGFTYSSMADIKEALKRYIEDGNGGTCKEFEFKTEKNTKQQAYADNGLIKEGKITVSFKDNDEDEYDNQYMIFSLPSFDANNTKHIPERIGEIY